MRPLAITAHYDDMEISAGGTMARYNGHSIVVKPQPGAASRDEAKTAAETLGVTLAPHIITTGRGLIREIDKTITLHTIDTIITCNPDDSHPDHNHATKVAQQAARKAGINLLYMDYAIPGGIHGTGTPNFYVTINPVKYDAMRHYRSQIVKYGDRWVDTVKARDMVYGFQHGVEYAEGFTVADWLI